MRKKSFFLVFASLLLVVAGAATKAEAEAEVNVNVGINLPPVRYAAPPEVVVIPGTYVYIVPDLEVDVLFFQGYWWRPYEGHWYRSSSYEGRWRHVEPRKVPRGLSALPPDYRHRVSPGYERVHHRDVQKNWKRWEKDKRWDKRGDQGRDGHKDQGRGGRNDQGRGNR